MDVHPGLAFTILVPHPLHCNAIINLVTFIPALSSVHCLTEVLSSTSQLYLSSPTIPAYLTQDHRHSLCSTQNPYLILLLPLPFPPTSSSAIPYPSKIRQSFLIQTCTSLFHPSLVASHTSSQPQGSSSATATTSPGTLPSFNQALFPLLLCAPAYVFSSSSHKLPQPSSIHYLKSEALRKSLKSRTLLARLYLLVNYLKIS